MKTERKTVLKSSSFSAIPASMERVRVELFGDRRAVMEGCAGITEYEQERITVKTCDSFQITFCGKGLAIRCIVGVDKIDMVPRPDQAEQWTVPF